jgi:uncharacterized protein YbjT (DUF2867 family)
MQNYVQFYGAGIREVGEFANANGGARISHIDATDIAACAAVALLAKEPLRRHYDLTGPSALSDAEIAWILSVVVGSDVDYRSLTEAEAAARPRLVQELSEFYRSGAAAKVTSDVYELLDRSPRSFAEFAEDHRDAFQPVQMREKVRAIMAHS